MNETLNANEKIENIDIVNNPPHYTHGMECIDEMEKIFGVEATMHFCLLNAWKYRKRAIFKNGEEDVKKSDWYIDKYIKLKNKIGFGKVVLDGFKQ